MKLRWSIGLVLGLGLGVAIAKGAPPDSPAPANTPATDSLPAPSAGGQTLKTLNERASYAIGLDIGRGMKSQGVEIDQALFLNGLTAGLTGGKSLLSDTQLEQTMVEFKKDLVNRIAEKNKKDGEAFLTANKKKEGITTLPSGLQYKVIKEGSGATPKASDVVTTNYRGTLIDGSEFDSSAKHGGPASFPVKGVIAGWTEALQHMKVGDKWQLFVPAELAYGADGAGPEIGPNTALIFEIELVAIKSPQSNRPLIPLDDK